MLPLTSIAFMIGKESVQDAHMYTCVYLLGDLSMSTPLLSGASPPVVVHVLVRNRDGKIGKGDLGSGQDQGTGRDNTRFVVCVLAWLVACGLLLPVSASCLCMLYTWRACFIFECLLSLSSSLSRPIPVSDTSMTDEGNKQRDKSALLAQYSNSTARNIVTKRTQQSCSTRGKVVVKFHQLMQAPTELHISPSLPPAVSMPSFLPGVGECAHAHTLTQRVPTTACARVQIFIYVCEKKKAAVAQPPEAAAGTIVRGGATRARRPPRTPRGTSSRTRRRSASSCRDPPKTWCQNRGRRSQTGGAVRCLITTAPRATWRAGTPP